VRIFMALSTCTEVSDLVLNIQDKLKKNKFYGSWPMQNNVHLTLFFFGEIDADRSKRIVRIMDEVAPKIGNFSLSLNTLGFFPRSGLPRVIWLGCKNDENVQNLYREMNFLLKKRSFGFREKFTPHVTIGRIKGVPKGWREILSTLEYKPVEFKCDHVELLSSKLTPRGSVYTLVHKSKLGGLHYER